MSKIIDFRSGSNFLREPFKITSVCRGDIDPKQYPKKFIASLTDDDMNYIARKMGDLYCDCCFWIALECKLNDLMEKRGFKRIDG